MEAHTNGELDTFLLLQTGIEVTHGSKHSQPSPYCTLLIIFVCLRIAKVDEETIPEQLGNMAIKALDYFGTKPLICTHHITVFFGIELGGKFGGVHEVTKHHGEL